MQSALFVFFVVSVNHAFEQGPGLISQSTGIQVNQQENGQHKSNNHMQHIIKQESADIEYGVGYELRKHKRNPGNDQQRHAQIHGKYVGYLLQRIELLFFGDRKGMRAPFKNSNGIEMKLFPEFGPEVFPPLPVIGAIACKHVANNKYPEIKGQNDTTNIVDGHRGLKRDQAGFRRGIMKAKPCNKQYNECKCVYAMPEADP
jgi:hypothetical protein